MGQPLEGGNEYILQGMLLLTLQGMTILHSHTLNTQPMNFVVLVNVQCIKNPARYS